MSWHNFSLLTKIQPSNYLGIFTKNKTSYKESESHANFQVTETSQRLEELQNEIQPYYVLQKTDPNQYTRIIRGNFHQADERFDWLSRGKQSITVSIVALTFFKINENPATWKTDDINNILIYGDILYHASFKKMKREGTTPQAEYLLISEVYPFNKIGRQYYCFNRMDEDEKNIFNINNLLGSLNHFFIENENQCGVFTWNIYSFAIMRNSNSYFLFNSYPTSYAGDPMDANDAESTLCVMEMLTINCLANHLLSACRQERSDNSECYSLIKIFIEKNKFGVDVSLRQKVNRDLCVAKKNTRGAVKENSSGILGKKEQRCEENVHNYTLQNNTSILNENELFKKASAGTNQSIDSQIGDNTGYEFDTEKIVTEVVIGCGMLNLGNSCFFNTCLKAFFHIPTINIQLQKIKVKKCTCVACNIIAIFKETHTQKNGSQRSQLSYNPLNLYNVLRKRNKDLLNHEQQDAHEFWIRLLEAMGNKENCSIKLDKLFLHDVVTTVKCEHCHENSETKRECIGHVIDVGGRLSIHEAVDAYFAEEVIDIYFCEHCGFITENETKKRFSLETAPKILYIALNRFENRVKKICENININGQSTLLVSNKNNPINYTLVSTINHYGADIFRGHYTSIACGSNHSFHEFNDSYVKNICINCNSNCYKLYVTVSAYFSE